MAEAKVENVNGLTHLGNIHTYGMPLPGMTPGMTPGMIHAGMGQQNNFLVPTKVSLPTISSPQYNMSQPATIVQSATQMPAQIPQQSTQLPQQSPPLVNSVPMASSTQTPQMLTQPQQLNFPSQLNPGPSPVTQLTSGLGSQTTTAINEFAETCSFIIKEHIVKKIVNFLNKRNINITTEDIMAELNLPLPKETLTSSQVINMPKPMALAPTQVSNVVANSMNPFMPAPVSTAVQVATKAPRKRADPGVEVKRCIYLPQRGIKTPKGEPCGKKCVDGYDYCRACLYKKKGGGLQKPDKNTKEQKGAVSSAVAGLTSIPKGAELIPPPVGPTVMAALTDHPDYVLERTHYIVLHKVGEAYVAVGTRNPDGTVREMSADEQTFIAKMSVTVGPFESVPPGLVLNQVQQAPAQQAPTVQQVPAVQQVPMQQAPVQRAPTVQNDFTTYSTSSVSGVNIPVVSGSMIGGPGSMIGGPGPLMNGFAPPVIPNLPENLPGFSNRV